LRVIGLIMAFGAGVLISALFFDLVEEPVKKSSGHGWVVAGVFAGCGVFFGGDRLIDRLGSTKAALWAPPTWSRSLFPTFPNRSPRPPA